MCVDENRVDLGECPEGASCDGSKHKCKTCPFYCRGKPEKGIYIKHLLWKQIKILIIKIISTMFDFTVNVRFLVKILEIGDVCRKGVKRVSLGKCPEGAPCGGLKCMGCPAYCGGTPKSGIQYCKNNVSMNKYIIFYK